MKILLALHFRVIESISHIIWILLLKKKIKKLMKCLKKIIYKQGFIQTVLLMSIFEKKIEFLNVIFCEKRSQNYPTIKRGACRHCKLRIGFMAEPYWEFRGKSSWSFFVCIVNHNASSKPTCFYMLQNII